MAKKKGYKERLVMYKQGITTSITEILKIMRTLWTTLTNKLWNRWNENFLEKSKFSKLSQEEIKKKPVNIF